MYFQRWEIEKKYHTLKNKMKFESITGKSTIYVDQDFRAQVLVYNMLQDIRKEADGDQPMMLSRYVEDAEVYTLYKKIRQI